ILHLPPIVSDAIRDGRCWWKYFGLSSSPRKSPTSRKAREAGHPGQPLLLISLLALRSVGVVILNAGLNVSDCLLSEIQSLDAVSALVSIRFLQFFRGFAQMLKSGLHMGLRLIVSSGDVPRSQRHQRNCEHDFETC